MTHKKTHHSAGHHHGAHNHGDIDESASEVHTSADPTGAASASPALSGDATAAGVSAAIDEAAMLAKHVSDAVQREAEVRDQLLRLAADFDNFRKRMRREQDDLRRYGVEYLATDLLEVLDNFNRALDHSGTESKNPVVEGIRMVAKQLGDILARHGVSSFESVGQVFDPERHEAIGQIPVADQAVGTVINEAQKGYLLHDRLLRPAKVVVAGAMPATMVEEAGVSSNGDDGG